MEIQVPFIASRNDYDCGLVSPMMVLNYFEENYSFEELSKEVRQLESGMVWTLGVLRAVKKFGFPVKFISSSNFSHEEDDIEFYKKYANDKAMLVLKNLEEEVVELNCDIEEKNMNLDELLFFVTKDSVPIVLLNWYVISGKEGFNGHFVPVVGYDDKEVYIHNPGVENAQAFMHIEKSLFQKAWESKGTDKDTIIVFRKEEI